MKIGVDYIGISAGAIITNNSGKYFLAKRGSKARDDIGKWEFPGGVVDFYETRDEAVVRIIREKHDFDIEVIEELGVYDVIDRKNKDHWLSTTYICRIAGGTPKIVDPEKCEQIGWFTFDEIQHMDLSRISQLNMTDLLKSRSKSLVPELPLQPRNY